MGNIDKISKFSMKKGHFQSEENKFQLYQNDTDRIALIYGRNGSGKSTIASAFNDFKNTPDSEGNLKFYDREDETLIPDFDNDYDKAVHVFDETYINEKVRFQTDKLGTIVLLGEQVEIEKQLSKNKDKISKLNQHIKKQDKLLLKLTKQNTINFESELQNQCGSVLRDRWALAEQNIKGKKIAAKVTINVIKTIAKNSKPKLSLADLNRQYNDLSKLIKVSSVHNSIIDKSVPQLQSLNIHSIFQNLLWVDNRIRNLNSSPLLSFFHQDLNKLNSALNYLSDEKNEVCENCLQKIDSKYRSYILGQLHTILNQELKKDLYNIKKMKIRELDISNYTAFQHIDPILYEKIEKIIDEINLYISSYNNYIDKRLENPYNDLNIDFNSEQKKLYVFDDNYHILIELIDRLEKHRIEYNSAIENSKPLKKKIEETNAEIAYYEIIDKYTKIVNHFNKIETQKVISKRLEEQKEIKNVLKQRLEERLYNTDIAVTQINQSLKYLFYSNDRLQLVSNGQDGYSLLVNGSPVAPKNISIGERNALALSYFFTDISKNEDANNPYQNEMFIVLDDPISSFDFGNKVGIITLLHLRVNQILLGNSKTKCIIMTHDLSVMFDFMKCFGEISKILKSSQNKASLQTIKLQNRQFTPFKQSDNEYSNLISDVYNFASSSETDSTEDNTTIGNTIRRVLEAFSTFSYKIGIDNISINEEILTILPNEFREYFSSSMYRLILNGQSHSQEIMQGELERFVSKFMSIEEKRRTAKDVLTFMYLLNPLHVLLNIDIINKTDLKLKIEQWKSEIVQIVCSSEQ